MLKKIGLFRSDPLKAVFAILFAVAAFSQASGSEMSRLFANPPDDCRIMMRWWWFGPAVTKPELEREMIRMKEGGIGGFEVQPVYPLALDDASTGINNYSYLSGEFFDALRVLRVRFYERFLLK